jgi:hypothetical protein
MVTTRVKLRKTVHACKHARLRTSHMFVLRFIAGIPTKMVVVNYLVLDSVTWQASCRAKAGAGPGSGERGGCYY